MKYNLLCFQISGRLIIFFNKHDYQVLTSLMKENKRYKRLKTAKWISIRKLVPGLLLTVRSAGLQWKRGTALQNYELKCPTERAARANVKGKVVNQCTIIYKK